MPLRLEVKKECTARSERVKSVDLFPAEQPWVLTALYSGHCVIYDYTTSVRDHLAGQGWTRLPPMLTFAVRFPPSDAPAHPSCSSRALRCARCPCGAPSSWCASSGSSRARTTCTCACTTTTRWRKSRCVRAWSMGGGVARRRRPFPSPSHSTPASYPVSAGVCAGVGGAHGLHPVRGGAPEPALHHQLLGRHVDQALGLGPRLRMRAGTPRPRSSLLWGERHPSPRDHPRSPRVVRTVCIPLQLFEGHAHYVMMIKINPKDTNTFASASLDRSIKVRHFGVCF